MVKAHSYSLAAEKISLSQSSVSKHVLQMERELGVRLLERNAHQVTLTDAGKAVFKDMEDLWNTYQEMLEKVKPYQKDRRSVLKIGGVNHLQKVGAMAPIIEFMRKNPNINVNFEEDDTLTLMKRLREGKIDLALVAHIYSPFSKDDNLEKFKAPVQMYTIVKDLYCLAVNRNHRLARRSHVEWSDLDGENLILLDKKFSSNQIIKNMLNHYGCVTNISFETNGVDSIQGMIAENHGITILSRKIIEKMEGAAIINIDNPIHRDTVLIRSVHLSEVGQSFWDFFVSYCKKNLPCQQPHRASPTLKTPGKS